MKYYRNPICGGESSGDGFRDGAFYSLFIGLNDKYTGVPRFPVEEAVEFVQEVCGRCFINGFTILTGSGANRCSSTVTEPSIYIMAINADEEQVFRAAEALQCQLNPGEILIEKNKTRYLYVSE